MRAALREADGRVAAARTASDAAVRFVRRKGEAEVARVKGLLREKQAAFASDAAERVSKAKMTGEAAERLAQRSATEKILRSAREAQEEVARAQEEARRRIAKADEAAAAAIAAAQAKAAKDAAKVVETALLAADKKATKAVAQVASRQQAAAQIAVQRTAQTADAARRLISRLVSFDALGERARAKASADPPLSPTHRPPLLRSCDLARLARFGLTPHAWLA